MLAKLTRPLSTPMPIKVEADCQGGCVVAGRTCICGQA